MKHILIHPGGYAVVKTCFIMMPFSDPYLNQYYQKTIKPAVEELGIKVVRADDIYGVKPVIDDIFYCIKNSNILIADVTGKNPNVNYELGAAHILNKDVIIIAQSMEDVPFDYKHRRIIIYDTKSVDFSKKLSDDIQNTIRILDIEEEKQSFGFNANEIQCTITDTSDPSEAVLKGEGHFVHLSTRDGTIDEWDKNAAKHILHTALKISSQLTNREILMVRSIFYDCNPCVTTRLDYIFDNNTSPTFNKSELESYFDDEFDGIIFNADIRVIKANFGHDRFNPNNKGYYDWGFNGDSALGYLYNEEDKSPNDLNTATDISNDIPILQKDNDGFYTCVIDTFYPLERDFRHTFYKISGLLPLSEFNDSKYYADNESHWLAMWNNKLNGNEIRLNANQKIKFKVKKDGIGKLDSFSHVNNCRNITVNDVRVC